MRKSGQPAKATPQPCLCDIALVVLIAVFAISLWPTLSFRPIALDDRATIEHFARTSFARVWGPDHFGHLRPLKNVYFWCLAQRPELSVSLRTLNLFTAMACAWLVRSLGRRLGLLPLWAALAGALWLFNPTTPIGVVWLSASNHLFALLGSLLYLLALENAGAWRVAVTSRRGRGLWIFGHVALLLAALSHELALLTPLWLVFRWTWQKPTPALRTLALPLCLGAATVSALPCVLRVLHTAPVLAYRSSLPAPQLMAAAARNLALNLRLWLWLQGRFGVLLSQTAALETFASISAWLVVLIASWWLWTLAKTDALLAQAVFWVLLFLAPLINLIPLGVTPVAMHYLMLPGVGLAWLSTSVLARVTRRSARLTLLLGAALLLSWQPAFRQSIGAYRSETSLYEASLANYPDNVEVRVNLIAAYDQVGDSSRAQQLLDISLQLAPQHSGLLRQQLMSLVQRERLSEASAWFEQHEEWVQSDPDLSLRRALLLRQLGQSREAERQFEHVLSIAPQAELRALAGYQLANLQVQTGRLVEAQTLLRRLHDEFPDNADIALALRLITEILQPPASP